jgi:diguanylate cyclase (GGDEF)-like protein
MGKRLELARLLVGADPKLRRMMQYWAATAVLYTAFLGLLYDARMGVPRGAVHGMALYTVSGIAAFYLMVRASPLLGLAPTTLAVLQGVFGVSCNMWAYSIAGPLRGATLMGLIVVVVFCTFALRPRQTLLLAFAGLLGMGGTMWWNHLREPLRYPAAVEVGTFAIMAACSLAVTFLTGEMTKLRARLKTKKMALEAAVETIRTLATIDELTALANRRHMNEVLALEQRRTPKHGPTCVALLDIDFFKQINDRHGHAAGDAVLRAFAQAARAELRDGDVLARWGGEEFLLMLPDTQPGDARAVLGRVRARVAALALPGLHLERPVSFSAGLSALHGDETFADTISRADKALYQAKAAGRDRVMETY